MEPSLKIAVEAQKYLPSVPDWREKDGVLNLISALDADEITLSTLRLRGRCEADCFDGRLTFQLEYFFKDLSKWAPAARVDWRPRAPHQNRNIGPKEWRLVSLRGSHIHPFQLNYDWSISNGQSLAENIRSNLPIAIKVDPEPNTIQALISFVGLSFNIDGLDRVPSPPWSDPRLL